MRHEPRPRARPRTTGPLDPATVATVGCAIAVIGVAGVLARVALPEHLAASWVMIGVGAAATATALWWQRGRRRRELTGAVVPGPPTPAEIRSPFELTATPPRLELGPASRPGSSPAALEPTSARTDVSDRLAR